MTEPADSNETERIVGVDRVLRVLSVLAAHPTGISLEEMSRVTGAAKPTVHRALTSLAKAGYARTVSRGVYVLGDEFLRLAFLNHRRRPLALLVRPMLEQLVERFGETVHYAALDGQDIVYRDKVEPPNEAIKLMSTIGGRTPAYRTAVGKLLLSYRLHSPDEIREWAGVDEFPGRTTRTIRTMEAMHEELERIREVGYAVDNQENELEVNCIAVPVMLKHETVPTSAISVSALAFRTTAADLISSIREIKEIVSLSGSLSVIDDDLQHAAAPSERSRRSEPA